VIAAWRAEPRTTRGGQPWYSALAILTALTLRAVFRLADRQAEGLLGAVVGLLGLALRVPDHTTLMWTARERQPISPSPRRRAAQAEQTGGLPLAFEGPCSVVCRPKPDLCRSSRQVFETASPAVRKRRFASVNGPVRCALMSGLSRGRCRWPSWVCARVPGTNLSRALEAQGRMRCRLDCLDHSLSHHAAQRFLPGSAGLAPAVFHRAPERHAVASAAAATRPFAR
jgi:hypothetical protein